VTKTLLAQIIIVKIKDLAFTIKDVTEYVISKMKEQFDDLTSKDIKFLESAVPKYLLSICDTPKDTQLAFKFVKDEDETLTDALYGHHVIPSLIIEFLLQNDFLEEIESKQIPIQVDEQDVRDLKRII